MRKFDITCGLCGAHNKAVVTSAPLSGSGPKTVAVSGRDYIRMPDTVSCVQLPALWRVEAVFFCDEDGVLLDPACLLVCESCHLMLVPSNDDVKECVEP